MQDNVTLKPCPFCGGVEVQSFHHQIEGWEDSWHVECMGDNCGNCTCHHVSEAEAITAWNTRASTTAQSEAVQKLVDALEALVGETLGGDLSRDDENQVTPRGSYQTWISWSDRWAARDALAAHRESQP